MAVRLSILTVLAYLLGGCATQTKPTQLTHAKVSKAEQQQAQAKVLSAQPSKLELKRKIALGRITNETLHGRSLLVDDQNDRLGKQLADMLATQLTQSGNFVVMEYPDLGKIQEINRLSGKTFQFRGVDTLILGSLTKFGRKTIGETGFLSATKKQVAFAELNIRLVDSSTGRVYQSISGSGEAAIESGSIAGFGSRADYDATLNDKAIANAVADAVDKLSRHILERPWFSRVIKHQGQQLIVSGGKRQGLTPGMTLDVYTQGESVRSEQTGFDIQLPGEKIARIKVISTFGSNETNEGAVTKIISGQVGKHSINQLIIRQAEGR